MKVIVVGSGLAAVAAAKKLVSKGLKPLLLDNGQEIDPEIKNILSGMSLKHPSEWTKEEKKLFKNSTVHSKDEIPKKLSFGSDFFYGNSDNRIPINDSKGTAPFSYAEGGMSIGWAGSVLPPDFNEMKDWPLNALDLSKYYSEVLEKLPYSANDDSLKQKFPIYAKNTSALCLNKGNIKILKKLRKKFHGGHKNLQFGQSRLLVHNNEIKSQKDCRYCGYCMSGCVYGSIYKAKDDLNQLIKSGEIDYIRGLLVSSIKEFKSKVNITALDKNHHFLNFECDKVFIGAGAVNSTRIILKSIELFDFDIELKSTTGFIVPMLSKTKIPSEWPNTSTLPGIFVEFKNKNLDKWVHAQVSTPNELVLEKLGLLDSSGSRIKSFIKYLIDYTAIVHCNMHSDFGYPYTLRLIKSPHNEEILDCQRKLEPKNKIFEKEASKEIKKIMKEIGLYTLESSRIGKPEDVGYHIGGSIPMKKNPTKEMESDIYGTPSGFSKTHVIDSSIFPSVPGTTIGLLSMANATRIVDQVA